MVYNIQNKYIIMQSKNQGEVEQVKKSLMNDSDSSESSSSGNEQLHQQKAHDPQSSDAPIKGRNLKRRQINDEKKEVTALFEELVNFINKQVLELESQPFLNMGSNIGANIGSNMNANELISKTKLMPAQQPQLKKKATKVSKAQKQSVAHPKKMEKQKSVNEISSACRQFNSKINANGDDEKEPSLYHKESALSANLKVQNRKKEIFKNYPLMMNYKFHQSQQMEDEGAHAQNVSNDKEKDALSNKKDQISANKRRMIIERSVEVIITKQIRELEMSDGIDLGVGSQNLSQNQSHSYQRETPKSINHFSLNQHLDISVIRIDEQKHNQMEEQQPLEQEKQEEFNAK